MSTESSIGIRERDGTIHVIYCHFDGGLHDVGRTLHDHYTSEKKIRSLLALGDISSLKSTLLKTVAYHRDRGEEISLPRAYARGKFKPDEMDVYVWDVKTKKWMYMLNKGKFRSLSICLSEEID
jgi:hypothetical protein